ncbi:hypothetical protein VNO77_44686 [Canavalia gladiata]|uniref:Uncharacterized protein n=1 Tax=Canavalia gladiata TaxID=3824 RepID=A0AAN9JWC8_CANGL
MPISSTTIFLEPTSCLNLPDPLNLINTHPSLNMASTSQYKHLDMDEMSQLAEEEILEWINLDDSQNKIGTSRDHTMGEAARNY